jgi:hypothetical protein
MIAPIFFSGMLHGILIRVIQTRIQFVNFPRAAWKALFASAYMVGNTIEFLEILLLQHPRDRAGVFM